MVNQIDPNLIRDFKSIADVVKNDFGEDKIAGLIIGKNRFFNPFEGAVKFVTSELYEIPLISVKNRDPYTLAYLAAEVIKNTLHYIEKYNKDVLRVEEEHNISYFLVAAFSIALNSDPFDYSISVERSGYDIPKAVELLWHLMC